MIYKELKKWIDTLPLALWLRRTLTQAMPFSLVYGADVTVHVEIMVPSVD